MLVIPKALKNMPKVTERFSSQNRAVEGSDADLKISLVVLKTSAIHLSSCFVYSANRTVSTQRQDVQEKAPQTGQQRLTKSYTTQIHSQNMSNSGISNSEGN